ncbi:MAG TPA: YggS family pyridoxal phosphate-dependent enzyme [Gillisia sp.]|nr:YggS family pyridoxal phosphate-dependent enzyme [Gillisia sp.]
MNIAENIKKITSELGPEITLVAISKTKPHTDILEAYATGQRDFGENKVQEMTEKWEALPRDINWHMVGHVQTNKVKYMAPFVSLVHAVDSLKLLKEIDKEAGKNDRIIKCLLQIKIAEEESKFGLSRMDAEKILKSEKYKNFKHIKVCGLMGMATFTEDMEQVKREFLTLKVIYDDLKSENPDFDTLSMGMSGDYKVAIECGSNMVRIGSSIFGER